MVKRIGVFGRVLVAVLVLTVALMVEVTAK